MSRSRTLVWFVALALLVGACFRSGGPDADQADLKVDGSATITTVDGEEETVTGSATLDFGDRVVMDEGTAVVEFAGGDTYELRAGPSSSSFEIGSPPVLHAGEVLVTDGFPASVKTDSGTVAAQGATKIDADAPRVVSYTGRARIDGAGDLEEVVRLRQVVLTSSASPEPVDYDGTDEWDRRYLASAIAFGERLEALARGYTLDLGPGGGRSASFFEAVIPALDREREFTAGLLGDREVGETLVGAAIVVQGRSGTFTERWRQVFEFRDEGAVWGIVALDQGVSAAPLLETVELAISSPEPTTPPTVAPRPTPTVAPPPDTPSTPPTTTTTTPPEPPPEPPPTTGILGPVLDPAIDVLADLLEAIGL